MTSTISPANPSVDPTPHPADPPSAPDPTLGPLVKRVLARRRTAVLATASPSGRAHAAPVLYQLVEGDLWVSTHRSSRKGMNVAANPRVAVTVPVRRLPLGPPAAVHLQATAELVAVDDPHLAHLVAAGRLGRVTSHGELDLEGGCFLRIALPSRVPIYGLGMSLRRFATDPLAAGRTAQVDW